MGRAKAKPAELFLRFGPWHSSERSRNYATGGTEAGVSVYDVKWSAQRKRWDVQMPPEEDADNPWGADDTFWALIKDVEQNGDPIFIVSGDVVGVGHDGEPLIQNVRIVHRIAVDDLMSKALRWRASK